MRRRFIKYSRDGKQQPPMYKRLIDQDTIAKRKQIAADFVRSVAFVGGFDFEASWMAPLLSVFRSLGPAAKQGRLDAAKQQAQQFATQHAAQFLEIKNQLWNSMYA